ncbi:LysR family transcriptional regulator [Devosia sp. A369]
MAFRLRQMEIFRAVMITGSTSGAARMLFVSQPVVSRAIAHLEESLGIALFDRVAGTLIPTDDARIIFREVERVYLSALQVNDLVKNLKSRSRHDISFCSSPSLGMHVIPEAIRRYRTRFPQSRFVFRTALLDDIPMELLGKRSEFAISTWHIEHPNLICTPLFEGRLALAIPKDHALAKFDVVRLSQLGEVPLILFKSGMPIDVRIREALAAQGVEVKPVIEVDRMDLVCSMVHHGVGVGFVDSIAVDPAIWNGLVVKDIDVDIPLAIWLVSSRFEDISKEARAFVNSLRPT